MALTFKEELALKAAFMEIQRERRLSLQNMFEGTRLRPKGRVEDAKTLAKSVKDSKDKLRAVPGVGVPDLRVPSINVRIFEGIDLRALVNFRIPTLSLPGLDLSWIPDITLGSLPGFDLSAVRAILKGVLRYKDLLPTISLRALVYRLVIKWPDINVPALLMELSKILRIDFDVLFPGLKIRFPDFFVPDFNVRLPHLSLPDVNFPRLPSLDLPEVDLSALRVDIPGFDLPRLLQIPGFDKVLRLLCELFDSVDLGEIIAELGLDFISEFLSSALPVVQQIKSGAQAAKEWGTAAMDWHKSIKTREHRQFLLPGNARDACDAVAELLRNSRNEHAALATIKTVQFGTSTAGLFADLGGATGPAVAAAAAVATTCQKVMIMGARYKEMKKINQILATTPGPSLTSNIFKVSPLLGCYYLANNTTSNVLNVLSNNIIEDDWMAQWEVNKRKHLDPLIRECQRFIGESRYVLEPLRQTTGMYVERSMFEKLKAGALLAVKKKLGMAPATARVSTHRYIG